MSSTSSVNELPWIKTNVFWDLEDFPLPSGCSASGFRWIISEAMRKMGFFFGYERIRAYGKKLPEEVVRDLRIGCFTYEVIEDKYWRTAKMLVEMSRLAFRGRDSPYEPSNIVIIAKDTSDADSIFFNVIGDITAVHCNTILVLPRAESGPIPRVSAAWFWEDLISEGTFIPLPRYLQLRTTPVVASPPTSPRS